jgi:pyruvate ferredoxin oxidoreductase beta subunit
MSNQNINTQEKISAMTTCAGCPIGLIARTVLEAVDGPAVVTGATGCMEVTSTIYPNTSWKVPYIHSVFGNAGATISGIETAWRALKKRERVGGALTLNKDISEKPPKDSRDLESLTPFTQGVKKPKFIAFAGDGGSYDIGLQALSGALERGHDFLFVTYDNEGYMNTGHQRSGATPIGSNTETTPAGSESIGKAIRKKDLMQIVTAHRPTYAATANIGFLDDYKRKVKKALAAKGPSFLLVFSPCVPLWKYHESQTINIAELGTKTNFWPLYEYENGEYKLSYEPKEKIPVEEFYKTQGRFKHLFKRDKEETKEIFQAIQKITNKECKKVKNLCK